MKCSALYASVYFVNVKLGYLRDRVTHQIGLIRHIPEYVGKFQCHTMPSFIVKMTSVISYRILYYPCCLSCFLSFTTGEIERVFGAWVGCL